MTLNQTLRATTRQRALIARLLSERDLSGTKYDGWTPDWTRSTSASADQVIDYLLTIPMRGHNCAGCEESDGESHFHVSDAAGEENEPLLD